MHFVEAATPAGEPIESWGYSSGNPSRGLYPKYNTQAQSEGTVSWWFIYFFGTKAVIGQQTSCPTAKRPPVRL